MRLPVYDGSAEQILRVHLRLMHGLYVVDEKSVSGLLLCHQIDHEDPFGNPIDHTHANVDPDPGEYVDVWDDIEEMEDW